MVSNDIYRKLIIRFMKSDELGEIRRIAKDNFDIFELTTLINVEWAYVLVWQSNIIGAIILNDISSQNKKIAFVDLFFIHQDYHGHGLGTYLNQEVHHILKAEGYQIQSSLVLGDNIASWSSFEKIGYQKVSIYQYYQATDFGGLMTLFFKTPFLLCIGMDLYLYHEKMAVTPRNEGHEWLKYLGTNLLIFIVYALIWQRSSLLQSLISYIALLLIVEIGKIIGVLLSPQIKWQFRFNPGGIGINLVLAIFGIIYLPVHAGYYPLSFRNTTDFKKEVGKAELCKWLTLVLVLIIVNFIHLPYFSLFETLLKTSLFYMMLPIYPFDEYGLKRISQFNRQLAIAIRLITLVLVFLLSI